jgi:hypothetical protein
MAFFIRCSDTANSLKNITCIGLWGLSALDYWCDWFDYYEYSITGMVFNAFTALIVKIKRVVF